jgi:prepilin-type N-terminal cleavage/methylation domain-containing protein
MKREPTPSSRARRGFTLVELLVVVGIIVILLAIFFPVVRTAQKKGLMVEDTNKMKQMAMLIASYQSDHNGRFPNQTIPIDGTATSETSPNRWNWFEAIDRYLPRVERFNATSIYNFLHRPNSPYLSKSAQPYPGWRRDPNYPEVTGPIAFGYNGNVNNPRWEGYPDRIQPSASKVVLVAEMNTSAANDVWPNTPAVFESNVAARYRVSHPGKIGLYMFCDFHVEPLEGDRGYNYFASRPGTVNMWRWW